MPPAPPSRHIRRIHIEIGSMALDYQARADQAQSVAERLTHGFTALIVTVDDDVRADLPPLPCAGLWD